MVKSDVVKIKRVENFDNTYIESELVKSQKDILRWAIVDVDSDFLTISVSYIN